jgi:hypothetical protein
LVYIYIFWDFVSPGSVQQIMAYQKSPGYKENLVAWSVVRLTAARYSYVFSVEFQIVQYFEYADFHDFEWFVLVASIISLRNLTHTEFESP